jgi:hypothetical protein
MPYCSYDNPAGRILIQIQENEAELEEALHDQRFYAEEPDSDADYLEACKRVDRLTDKLQRLDEKLDSAPTY